MWIHQELQKMSHLWRALPVAPVGTDLMTILTDSSLTNAREIMMITEAQREQIMVRFERWNIIYEL